MGGIGTNSNANETPFTWEASYEDGLGAHFAWSFSWLNEGRIEGHRRDGAALQLWAGSKFLDGRLSLSAGAGPYGYFDTVNTGDAGYEDEHGWGGVFSISAGWHMSNRWILQLRGNRVWANGSFDTSSILVGIGCRLAPPPSAGSALDSSAQPKRIMNNEITALAGVAILNSLESEDSFAGGVDYRRRIARFLDWTIGYMYEGSPGPINRSGIATQIWPTKAFFHDRLSIGVGLGAYLGVDARREELGESEDSFAAGLLSFTAGCLFNRNLVARLMWNRTITDYDRDTDVLLAGLGYRF